MGLLIIGAGAHYQPRPAQQSPMDDGSHFVRHVVQTSSSGIELSKNRGPVGHVSLGGGSIRQVNTHRVNLDHCLSVTLKVPCTTPVSRSKYSVSDAGEPGIGAANGKSIDNQQV